MEFGFEPICDQLRAGSSYLVARTCSKLVADRLEPCSFEPVCDQLRTSFEPDSVMEFGFNNTVLLWVSPAWLRYALCLVPTGSYYSIGVSVLHRAFSLLRRRAGNCQSLMIWLLLFAHKVKLDGAWCGVVGVRAGRARHRAVSRHVPDGFDDDRRRVPRHDRRRSHQLRQASPRVRGADADQAVPVGRLHVPHRARPPVRRLVRPTAGVWRQRKVGSQQHAIHLFEWASDRAVSNILLAWRRHRHG